MGPGDGEGMGVGLYHIIFTTNSPPCVCGRGIVSQRVGIGFFFFGKRRYKLVLQGARIIIRRDTLETLTLSLAHIYIITTYLPSHPPHPSIHPSIHPSMHARTHAHTHARTHTHQEIIYPGEKPLWDDSPNVRFNIPLCVSSVDGE